MCARFLSYLLLLYIGRVHGAISWCTVLGEVHPASAQTQSIISDTDMLRFDENKPNKLTRDYEWESTENIIYKYDMAKHTDKEEDWATYRECKSNITALIEQTKRDKNSLDENNKSHRNVWQTIDGIIGEAQMDRKIHCIGNYSDQ